MLFIVVGSICFKFVLMKRGRLINGSHFLLSDWWAYNWGLGEGVWGCGVCLEDDVLITRGAECDIGR